MHRGGVLLTQAGMITRRRHGCRPPGRRYYIVLYCIILYTPAELPAHNVDALDLNAGPCKVNRAAGGNSLAFAALKCVLNNETSPTVLFLSLTARGMGLQSQCRAQDWSTLSGAEAAATSSLEELTNAGAPHNGK